MINMFEVNETNKMITQENLDVRTITLGISLLDCVDADLEVLNENIYRKITTVAKDLVATGQQIEREYGIPIVNKRISITPIAFVGGKACKCPEDYVSIAKTLDRAAKEVGVNFIGGYSALVSKGMTKSDENLIRSIPEALSVTERVCSSVNVGSTKCGINMDAVRLMGKIVKQAAEYVDGKMAVCTVIGFPNGYMTTAAKEFETKDAVANGASEIDMVINIGWLKDKKYDLIEKEIRTLKAACGEKILKVIIETCFLTDEEKIKMCEIVTAAGADYIKTSTGFGGAGATFADIELFSKHIGPNVKMKAAGGISSLEDAEKFLSLGADRLGTSRIIKIVKNEKATGY